MKKLITNSLVLENYVPKMQEGLRFTAFASMNILNPSSKNSFLTFYLLACFIFNKLIFNSLH